MVELHKVPYEALFEEFCRRVAEPRPEQHHLKDGVIIRQVAGEFNVEFKRRVQEHRRLLRRDE